MGCGQGKRNFAFKNDKKKIKKKNLHKFVYSLKLKLEVQSLKGRSFESQSLLNVSMRNHHFSISFSPFFSVSAPGHSSIWPTTATATTPRCPTARAAVFTRIASFKRGWSPLLPTRSVTTISGVRVTPTAGITVATAISIPGTAAIVVITTASATPTVGRRGTPWGWGAAWVTCRVNGSCNWQNLLKHSLHDTAVSSAHFPKSESRPPQMLETFQMGIKQICILGGTS